MLTFLLLVYVVVVRGSYNQRCSPSIGARWNENKTEILLRRGFMYLMRRTYGSREFFTLSSEWEEKRRKNTSMLCVCGITFEKYAERVSLWYAMFHWGDYSKSSLVKIHKKKKKIGLHMHVVALRRKFSTTILLFFLSSLLRCCYCWYLFIVFSQPECAIHYHRSSNTPR